MEDILQIFTPDLIYLLLIVGLWLGVTAVYIPGTGLMEVLSVLTIGGALVLLTVLNPAWWAVLLMVVGIAAFISLPFVNVKWAPYGEVGLLLQGVGAFFMFDQPRVSIPLILLTLGIALVYHRIILLPILRNQQEDQLVDEDDLLIGAIGRVQQRITPERAGTVYVNGEIWTARSTSTVEANSYVIVLSREGLILQVEPHKPKEE